MPAHRFEQQPFHTKPSPDESPAQPLHHFRILRQGYTEHRHDLPQLLFRTIPSPFDSSELRPDRSNRSDLNYIEHSADFETRLFQTILWLAESFD